MKLTLTSSFCAAHRLPDHPGKCKNLHGHTWKVETTVKGPVDKKTGMMMDFSELKRLVNKTIDMFDHTTLNDDSLFTIIPPTAENLSTHLFELIQQSLNYSNPRIKVSSVRVWESDVASAIYEGEDNA